jgi:hypothetical protein
VGDTCCPDEKTEPAWYASHDPVECKVIDFRCDLSKYPTGAYFFTKCGCGCIDQVKYGCP